MNDIAEENANCFQKGNFKVGYSIDSNECIKWMPMILCWQPNNYIGITENGRWVVEERSGIRFLNTPQAFLRVEILLERPLVDIQTELLQNLCRNSIEELEFPYIDIISQVFINDSNYWVELAFLWFDTMPLDMKVLLKQELEIVRNRKELSQKLRHRAMKEHAKLKRLIDS